MFKIGKTYNRRIDIHGKFKGQQYGGIATPTEHPYVFIFTSDAGEAYGYKDAYGPDYTFWYTGEGQVGDMEMAKGNLAIRNHTTNNKIIMLFESVKTGHVRFLGECKYITHHIEQRPDRNDNLRSTIIFHLDVNQNKDNQQEKESKEGYISSKKPTKSLSLSQLREIAIRQVSSKANIKEVLAQTQYRAKAIKLYAKKRANGNCEGCGIKAPFPTKQGPYLEVHHLYRLADGGPDQPSNVIAVCPTCHRRAHYSTDANEYNSELIKKVVIIENIIT